MERNGKIRFAYERGQTTFVNPYHFVRLDPARDSRMKDSEEQKEQSLSGVLHCSFETMTPLAVPDTEKAVPDMGKKDECLIGGDSGKVHYRYPFYSINNRPTVPGSSVRGMLRSVYESLTDSCFVTIPDEERITARTDSLDAFKPAILRREAGNKWALYKATRYRVPIKEKDGKFQVDKDEKGRYIQYNHEKFRSGEKVDIGPGTEGRKKIVTSMKHTENGNRYVYVGENVLGKKYESVFEKGGSLDVSDDEIKELMNRLENTLKVYQNESINRCLKEGGHTGYAHYAEEKKRGVICVWYKKEKSNGKYYLSLASVGRKAYQNTVNDMIGKHRNPCHDRKDMCPACRLFGMAKGDSFGSRVRITDAVAENKDTPKKEVVLKELGSPRTGYYPFYTSNGQEVDGSDVTIAGRKFYWHIPEVNHASDIYTSKEKTIRNATMDLIDRGATFRFDVYYDGVTPEQLQELKWVITLPDEDKSLMHKLGHGKPLGLGSIKISIDSEYRRSFDGEGYHVQEVEEESESSAEIPPRFDKDTVEQLQILMDYDAMKGKKVTYPYIEVPDDVRKLGEENDFASHQWFTSNKGRSKYDPAPMTLKKITQGNPELQVYRAFKKEDSKNRSSHQGKNTGGGYKPNNRNNKRRW